MICSSWDFKTRHQLTPKHLDLTLVQGMLVVKNFSLIYPLGGCRTFGIEAFSKSGVAKFDPSKGSFCQLFGS